MYKVQLAVACLAAASSALNINPSHRTLNTLAQTSIKMGTDEGCCCHMMPCMPTCTNMCNEDDHEHEEEEAELEILSPVIVEISEEAEPIIAEIMEDIENEVAEQVETPQEANEIIAEIEEQVTEEVI